MHAARWATWLPPDAVTWIAWREKYQPTDKDGSPAVTDSQRAEYRKRQAARAEALAALTATQDN